MKEESRVKPRLSTRVEGERKNHKTSQVVSPVQKSPAREEVAQKSLPTPVNPAK